jgi:AP-4 complex subunit mu-1
VVLLDSCSIHEGVDAERFEAERVLELVPPDGQFALMNYRWGGGGWRGWGWVGWRL